MRRPAHGEALLVRAGERHSEAKVAHTQGQLPEPLPVAAAVRASRLVQQQVGQLQVAVHDARRVHVRDGCAELAAEVAHCRGRERAVAPQQPVQVAGVAGLHDDVHGGAVLEKILRIWGGAKGVCAASTLQAC